jgi:hypothetical protein
MSADRLHPSPPGPPPTLAYLAKQASGIEAECHDCRRRVVLGFERFLDRYGDVPFPDFARLMKCSACGSRNIDARPSWPAR